MSENGQAKFKAFIEVYTSPLRLIGAANATGALAAGAAYQAFEKRPEAQSSIKAIIVFFFAGFAAFVISQMSLFFLQMYMNSYFRRQTKASDWETTLLAGPDKPTSASDNLRMARYDLIVVSFSGLAALVLFLVGLGFVGAFIRAL
jgi:hypothetical protein